MVIEAIEYMYHSIGVTTKLSDYEIDDKVVTNTTMLWKNMEWQQLVKEEIKL